MTTETNNSFFERLWDRKVPQYLGTYLAVGFGLLQFLEFITNRYDLSGFWVDKYLLVWLLLLPAVAILIYFNGQPAIASNSIKWPKYVVSCNVLTAFLLGGFLFNGAVEEPSKVVELTNEEGETITAAVPSLHKVKKVASFQFENLTGNKEQDWWGVAFSELLQLHLEQRPEFYAFSGYNLDRYYDRLGLSSFAIPNVGMQREIAQKSRNDYFTRISYEIKNDQFVFKGHLHNTKDGKALYAVEAENTDPYAAIDAIKEQIASNIPGATVDLENQVSLPASSLITSNKEALRHYTQSQIAFNLNPNNLNEAISIVQKAVDLDPTCSLCYYELGGFLYRQGKLEEAIPNAKNAIKYGASLPKRMQFQFKDVLYAATNRLDAYFKLQEMHRKMFPYDYHAYERLIDIYKGNFGVDSAKALIYEAIDNGQVERGLLSLYDLEIENEEYEKAEKTLNRLSKEFPDRDQDRQKYATVYQRQGKLEAAMKTLQEEETLDPLNSDIQIRLAYLEFRNAEIEKAHNRIDQGVEQATTLTDSINFLYAKAHIYRFCGEVNKSLAIYSDYEKLRLKKLSFGQVLENSLFFKTDLYQSINQSEKVEDLLAKVNKYTPQFIGRYRCQTNGHALENGYKMTMNKEEYLACGEEFKGFGEGASEELEVYSSYYKGDYAKCVTILEKDNGRIKIKMDDEYFISKIYAKAGEIDKAKTMVRKIVDRKTIAPKYYLQMATLLEKEDPQEAKKYLNLTIPYWANADADYIPAQRATALTVRLQL